MALGQKKCNHHQALLHPPTSEHQGPWAWPPAPNAAKNQPQQKLLSIARESTRALKWGVPLNEAALLHKQNKFWLCGLTHAEGGPQVLGSG